MLSKASVYVSVAFHRKQDWTSASLYQLTYQARSASSWEALLPFVKIREVHHILKSSTWSFLQMHREPWHHITCESHSNWIKYPHTFSCVFFFSRFGFQSGLGLMPGVSALSEGGQGWGRLWVLLVQHCCTPIDPWRATGKSPQGFSQFKLCLGGGFGLAPASRFLAWPSHFFVLLVILSLFSWYHATRLFCLRAKVNYADSSDSMTGGM